MSEMTTTVMTRDEAETTNQLIKHYVRNARLLLLEMRDRKGWLALGYASFEEYGEKEFGYTKVHIYRLANAAEIEMNLKSNLSVTQDRELPETQLRPLAQVAPEARSQVWQSAQEKADADHGGKLTARLVEDAVAHWKQCALENHSLAADWEQKARKAEQALADQIPEIIEKIREVEVTPPDYDETKRQAELAAQLQTELEHTQLQLAQIQAEIARNTELAIRRGFQERQAELDSLEQRKEALERMVAARLDRFSRFNAHLDANQEIADECAKLAVAFGGFAATVSAHDIPGLEPRTRAQAERVRHLIDGAAQALDLLLSLPDLPQECEVREAL